MTKTRAGKFRNHNGYAVEDTGTPQRSAVHVRDVVCPDCQAAIGAKCLNSAGNPMHTYHASRRRMATRAANAGRDLVSAAYVQTLTPIRRMEIRQARGLSQREAAQIFGLTHSTFQAIESGERKTPDLHACAYGAWLRLWDPVTPTEESDT